jgi:hypothetical protein
MRAFGATQRVSSPRWTTVIPPFPLLPLTNILIGKTNQHGRIEYGAALRHRDYKSCLIGAIAVYFFWRWQHSGESFPSFRTSTDWYRIKVLKRDNEHLTDPLSIQTASTWTSRIFKACGIQSTKVQHAPRVKGGQIAEDRGVPEEQVKRFSPHFFYYLF